MDGAIEFWKVWVAWHPDSGEGVQSLVDAFETKGDMDAAIDFWKAWVTSHPDSWKGVQSLADALNRKGDIDAVIDVLESVGNCQWSSLD